MSLRSPVGRVLGLGSAKEGVSHWWSQRVTAVGLVLLGLWFACSLLQLGSFDHGAVVAWIGTPTHAVLLSLLIGTAAYHSQLGVQVVVSQATIAAAGYTPCAAAQPRSIQLRGKAQPLEVFAFHSALDIPQPGTPASPPPPPLTAATAP